MNIIETNLDFNNLSYGNVPNKIILHHAEASHCTVYDIHEWHKGNGWAGIGYHFFVDKQGNIYILLLNAIIVTLTAAGGYEYTIKPIKEKKEDKSIDITNSIK